MQESLSVVKVDLRTLRSDKARRDNYLRSNTFQSKTFPFAEFVVRQAPGLPWPLPTTGDMIFQLIGDMTIHGVTAPLVWDINVSVVSEVAKGTAKTNFSFDAFNMDIPSLFFILSVEDDIHLELDLVLDVIKEG
ncbi:YceI family protein [Dehalococcoidia bacterium]|nr:YceI family protein [Dehalococcoidia bacterium]